MQRQCQSQVEHLWSSKNHEGAAHKDKYLIVKWNKPWMFVLKNLEHSKVDRQLVRSKQHLSIIDGSKWINAQQQQHQQQQQQLQIFGLSHSSLKLKRTTFFNMKVGVMFLCFTWVSLNQLALIAEAQSTRLFKKMPVPGTYWPTTIYRWVTFNLLTCTFSYHSVLSLTHKPSLWWCPSSIILCVYKKLLYQSLSAITSVCSFHHRARPSVCWLSTKKDDFYELHWMFELQSCRSHKRRNDR